MLWGVPPLVKTIKKCILVHFVHMLTHSVRCISFNWHPYLVTTVKICLTIFIYLVPESKYVEPVCEWCLNCIYIVTTVHQFALVHIIPGFQHVDPVCVVPPLASMPSVTIKMCTSFYLAQSVRCALQWYPYLVTVHSLSSSFSVSSNGIREVPCPLVNCTCSRSLCQWKDVLDTFLQCCSVHKMGHFLLPLSFLLRRRKTIGHF